MTEHRGQRDPPQENTLVGELAGRIEIYCDESRPEYLRAPPPSGPAYVLIGGLWLRGGDRAHIKELIRRARAKHNLWAEFKWNRVTPSRLDFYRDVVDVFFDANIAFRCIALPARNLDAQRFHEGDRELMFYKFYYQLLVHWLAGNYEYRIFVDRRTNRLPNRLRVLEQVLRTARPECKNIAVQALPARQVELLQLVDVLLGATGFKLHGQTASEARLALVRSIEQRLGRSIGPTTKSEAKFNVFLFRPDYG